MTMVKVMGLMSEALHMLDGVGLIMAPGDRHRLENHIADRNFRRFCIDISTEFGIDFKLPDCSTWEDVSINSNLIMNIPEERTKPRYKSIW